MAVYGVAHTLTYMAWDTNAQDWKTGDVANHTIYWTKDGTASVATNSPAEVDATNKPGEYKVDITATEMQCQAGTLGGKSSTSGIVIFPVQVAPVRLPNVAAGANGGLPTVDANNYVGGVQGTVNNLNNLDAAVSTRSSHSAAGVWSVGTRALTDKAGFSLSSAGIKAIWDRATSGLTVAGSIGKLLVDNINAAIGSRSSHAAADVWSVATRVLTANTNLNDPTAAAIRSEIDSNSTKLDVAVSSRSDFDEASDQVTVATNNDKTGYSISGTLNTLDDVPQPYVTGTVSDASPAAGDFDGDAGLSTTDDFYNNAFLVFTDGTLKGIARPVQDYTGSSRNLDFTSQEFPVAPSNGDSFMIIGRNP